MKFMRCSEGLFLSLECKIIENPKVSTLQMTLNKKIDSSYMVTEMEGVDMQQRRSTIVDDFTRVSCLA